MLKSTLSVHQYSHAIMAETDLTLSLMMQKLADKLEHVFIIS